MDVRILTQSPAAPPVFRMTFFELSIGQVKTREGGVVSEKRTLCIKFGQNVGQHGDGTAHPHRQQAARCLHTTRSAYATGFAPNCSGRRSKCWQELSFGKLRRQVIHQNDSFYALLLLKSSTLTSVDTFLLSLNGFMTPGGRSNAHHLTQNILHTCDGVIMADFPFQVREIVLRGAKYHCP